MALVINTNVASLNAQRNLTGVQSQLSTALQRLSSGLRVNSARDDAAGMYQIEQMTADVRGINQAIRNAADGTSLGQTAEGALAQISNNLQRIREIAVQSANGTVQDRSGLQSEVNELTREISRIIQTTEFNGSALLSAATSITFQVGADGIATNQVAVTTTALTGAAGISAVYSGNLTGGQTVVVSTQAAASAVLTSVDAAINTVSSTRATFGAVQNRFDAVIANLQNYVENLVAARSRIQDADFAQETAALTRAQILQQSGVAMVAQANALPQAALALLK
jgi:flagellin